MSDVQFKDDSQWRGRGAPKVVIPEELQVWMERSYRDQSFFEIPGASETDKATRELLRLCRIYASRQQKKMGHQFVQDKGVTVLRIRMRDPRQYNAPTTARETS